MEYCKLKKEYSSYVVVLDTKIIILIYAEPLFPNGFVSVFKSGQLKTLDEAFMFASTFVYINTMYLFFILHLHTTH